MTDPSQEDQKAIDAAILEIIKTLESFVNEIRFDFLYGNEEAKVMSTIVAQELMRFIEYGELKRRAINNIDMTILKQESVSTRNKAFKDLVEQSDFDPKN